MQLETTTLTVCNTQQRRGISRDCFLLVQKGKLLLSLSIHLMRVLTDGFGLAESTTVWKISKAALVSLTLTRHRN